MIMYLSGEGFMLLRKLAHGDEGPDHNKAHLDRPGAVQYVRNHQSTMFGEGPRLRSTTAVAAT